MEEMELFGYVFHDEAMFEKAKKEESAIDYIKGQVDKNNPEAMLKLYTGLIERRFFSTIIGLDFLRKLQEELLSTQKIDPALVPGVPEYLLHKEAFVEKNEKKEEYTEKKTLEPEERKKLNQVIKKEKKKNKNLLIISIALFFVALSMLVLTFTSGMPTIINYENKILNRYSEWEESIKEREEIVREKERELLINTDE